MLSISEANKYYGYNQERKCAPTEYAITEGVKVTTISTDDRETTCWWWLRSPGILSNDAAYVDHDGSVGSGGYRADASRGGVRPALWIDLETAGLQNTVNTNESVSISSPTPTTEIPDYTVGDTLSFGSYEQDNDTSNGKEEIEWQVLAKENNKLLVISRYALDCQPYDTKGAGVTWETCSLRKWLNDTFLNAAFSTEENARILTVTVSADKNPDYSADPGNNTKDKVFLLSIPEANGFFSSDEERKCAPTIYAFAQDDWSYTIYKETGKKADNCLWWLRSPGSDSTNAAGVDGSGSILNSGTPVVMNIMYMVRPALWIDLES